MAADLTQETLIRLVRKVEAHAFDGTKGTLAAYAFGIAHFVRREAQKSARLAVRLTVIDEGEDTPSDDAPPDDRLALNEDLARLRRAIAALPEQERSVVALLVDRELTMQDIGGILGMPVGTVKSHAHRAKEHLRSALSVGRGVK
jgi:RNA polymerase sigma-70 factor (ECF subfamily)